MDGAKGIENRLKTKIIEAKRFVAYFDIMGFKDRVYRNYHEVSNMMYKLDEFISLMKKLDSRYSTNLKPIVFSDTILFISPSDSPSDLENVLSVCAFFLADMIAKKIPIKGAIAHGTFTTDYEKSLYFGLPLIDAYLLTNQVFFYGALLHNSIEKYLEEIKNKQSIDNVMKFIARKPIPTKSGLINHSYISLKFDWSKYSFEREMLEAFYLDVSGKPRKYVDNSLLVYFPSDEKD